MQSPGSRQKWRKGLFTTLPWVMMTLEGIQRTCGPLCSAPCTLGLWEKAIATHFWIAIAKLEIISKGRHSPRKDNKKPPFPHCWQNYEDRQLYNQISVILVSTYCQKDVLCNIFHHLEGIYSANTDSMMPFHIVFENDEILRFFIFRKYVNWLQFMKNWPEFNYQWMDFNLDWG